MKAPFRLLIAALLLVTVAGCGFAKSKQIAAKSVETFHQQFNETRFSAIYSGSTTNFKASAPEAEFLKFIQAVRRKLGAFQSGTETGWRTNNTTNGTFVVLTYNSQFERGKATETFTFVISRETATLQGYNVNSPELITDSLPAAQPATAQFSSADEAQREAVRRYPQLGVAGSPLNQDFVARHKRYQREHPEVLRDPSWPLRLAEESARTIKSQ
jgi:hypothetical protein